jgi:hypothetical protein
VFLRALGVGPAEYRRRFQAPAASRAKTNIDATNAKERAA